MTRHADARASGLAGRRRAAAGSETATSAPARGVRAGYSSVALAVLVLGGCGSPGEEMRPASAPDLLPVRCVEKLSPGDCGVRRPAFRYDYASASCRAVTDGGCGPTRPFSTLAECMQTCGARRGP